MKQQTAIVSGTRTTLEWTLAEKALDVVIDGRHYTLEPNEVQPGVYWFNWNGRSMEAVVVEDGQQYVVSINGHRIPVEFIDSRKALRRASQTDHDGVIEMRAPMPGKIVRVLAAEGSEVEIHQGIVVMEAMKMQNEIRSPKRGRIQKLNVTEGSAVNSNDLIALVE